jgi:hypothetical protein
MMVTRNNCEYAPESISRIKHLENFQGIPFILLLLVGRNSSRTAPFWGCQLFCLAQENKKAALMDGFSLNYGML